MALSSANYLGFVHILVLFLVCLDVGTCILSRNFLKIRETVEKHHRHAVREVYNRKHGTNNLQSLDPFPDMYLEQPLDHFDTPVGDKPTYKQRYWINTKFWKNKSYGPVFLYIGGEGGLSSHVVQGGEHVELAEKYGALIIGVEHRYYGNSVNDDGLLRKNIVYLSSQQALADLASFHSFASNTYNLTSHNKWICFGGSYPGALSAWFRLKYPHLVHGAIASSAPVKAITNFQGYNDVVAASLAAPVVNGSEHCAEYVRAAFESLNSMIMAGETDKLDKDFRSCTASKDPHDIPTLVSNVAGIFMGVVQYNMEGPVMNVSDVCQIMTSTKNAYSNLVVLNEKFLVQSKQNCSDNSWDSQVKQTENTTVDRKHSTGVGIRQWTYQTCTQFGYYQTCDKETSCLFSPQINLPYNLDLCLMAFDVTAEEVEKSVAFTNAYYGADQPRGSRIVFVNGSIDPWHALSVLQDESVSESAVFIVGTAHCANMHSNLTTDPKPLQQARQEIRAIVGQWIESE